MADSKITGLAALTTADPANDMLPIVDVSDYSMAASGTTKRISINNILACSPSATLASATITGDLTVDTNVLKVDSANNRVGIGTASPAHLVDVLGAGPRIRVKDNGTSWSFVDIENNSGSFYVGSDNNSGTAFTGTAYARFLWGQGAYPIIFGINNTERYRLASDGVATWSNVGGVAGTAMTLNSTGLGVGVSPAFKLSAAGVSQFYAESDGIYASGNLSPDLYTIGVNYYNAGGTEGVKVAARPSWRIEHKNSSDALAYLDIGFRAASAAASAFTSRFKIDGSGNPIFAPSATPATLTTNGQLTVNATSNTNLRFSYRGSDGTTRVANITLA